MDESHLNGREHLYVPLDETQDEAAYEGARLGEIPWEGYPANVVSSKLKDGGHSPALDIDMDVQLVPSSTPGHFHLYLPELELTWKEYKKLLKALARAGVIQQGYCNASIDRKASYLRIHHDKEVAS